MSAQHPSCFQRNDNAMATIIPQEQPSRSPVRSIHTCHASSPTNLIIFILTLIYTKARHSYQRMAEEEVSTILGNLQFQESYPIDDGEPDTRPLFLRLLPREIRDEIYKLVVLIGRPPPPSTLEEYFANDRRQLSSGSDPKPISINLSIIRVNKQIHEEAAYIFYSQTVFPVRILLDRCQHDLDECNVKYKAPWEDIHYRRYYYTPALQFDRIHLSTQQQFCRRDMRFPSLTYRHLIRKVQLNFYDQIYLCDEFGSFPISPRRSIDKGRPDFTKLLLFACYRLENALASPVREYLPEVEINAFLTSPADIQALQYPPDRVSDDVKDSVRREREGFFKEMIMTVWPLTNGLWIATLNICPYVQRDFPGLLEETIEECAERNRNDDSGWRRGRFGGPEIEIYPAPRFGKIYWMVVKGRLQLVQGY
ncbi:uncharacterized protein DFL_005827 [Arthrobotrys flagrans]|uniref:Uncharacterized protein n=1 Tax=Arthrobotrys flagrans TaxID=97331 RepID=A0A436ZYI5_ARTFL|nr:hypothetical protein DFL_005827 [Arthrobotrys flagrans]